VPRRTAPHSERSILGKYHRIGILGAIFLLLTSCSSIQFEQGPAQVTEVTLCPFPAEDTVGQTFVAHERGLTGVQVFLQPEQPGTGQILLHLRSEPKASEDIRTAILPIDQVQVAGFYLFNFEPLTQSRQQYSYAFLEFQGDGALSIQCLPGDAYIDGAMYRNHEPLDAQLNFQLSYDPLQALFGLVMELVKWIGILGIGLILYVIPGWALLLALWPESKLSMFAQMAIGVGISLAAYPIMLLWTDLIGLHMGPLYAWIPVVLGAAYLLLRLWKLGIAGVQLSWREWRRSQDVLPDLLLITLMGLVFLSRFYAVRTLDVPMWGDSYQHTMIAQLIVDNRGLFDSWAPYAPLESFTYHFGFHTAVAGFHWISGLSLIRSTLWVGQILNVLAIFALYPLALKVGKSKWAAVIAILIAGLLSPMPSYYANWGRYTQLAGQAILPAAVFVAWYCIEHAEKKWKLLLIGWILFAGLALTHYRILLFGMAFVPLSLIIHFRRSIARDQFKTIAILSVVSILIFLPWFVHIFPSKIMQTFWEYISTSVDSTSNFIQQYNAIGDISYYMPTYLWMLTFGLALYSLWVQNRYGLTIILWCTLLLLMANPAWLGLPGSGALSNFALFIAFYIFSAIIIGSGLDWFLVRKWSAAVKILLVMIILASCMYGFTKRSNETFPSQFSLVTTPDLRAATWIKENTEQSSQFLVNGFFAYGDSLVVGSDGGWWLPLTAERSNTVPPINYASEQGIQSNYFDQVNSLYETLVREGFNSEKVIDMLMETPITHVYIGQRQGTINYSGPHRLQQNGILLTDYFKLIYQRDRVWIYELQRGMR